MIVLLYAATFCALSLLLIWEHPRFQLFYQLENLKLDHNQEEQDWIDLLDALGIFHIKYNISTDSYDLHPVYKSIRPNWRCVTENQWREVDRHNPRLSHYRMLYI